jgi:hypothetical protein
MDDNEWHQHHIMGAIIMELHNSWKWVALYIWWVTTCSLAFIRYKYSGFQVSFAIQKLSYKASCKTPFFS